MGRACIGLRLFPTNKTSNRKGNTAKCAHQSAAADKGNLDANCKRPQKDASCRLSWLQCLFFLPFRHVPYQYQSSISPLLFHGKTLLLASEPNPIDHPVPRSDIIWYSVISRPLPSPSPISNRFLKFKILIYNLAFHFPALRTVPLSYLQTGDARLGTQDDPEA